MLQRAVDLREQGDELYALLRTRSDADWTRNTPFKNWTVGPAGWSLLRKSVIVRNLANVEPKPT